MQPAQISTPSTATNGAVIDLTGDDTADTDKNEEEVTERGRLPWRTIPQLRDPPRRISGSAAAVGRDAPRGRKRKIPVGDGVVNVFGGGVEQRHKLRRSKLRFVSFIKIWMET